jgi:hypothetical protein
MIAMMMMMLPLVSDHHVETLLKVVSHPEQQALWQRGLIEQLKAYNPELATALVALAEKSGSPQAVINGGFAVYQLLHWAELEQLHHSQAMLAPLPSTR